MVNPTDNQENVDDIKEGENDNSDQIKAKVRSDTNSISKCEGTSNAIRCSVITKKSISPVQGTNEELILSDNNKKMKYVHKKFGVAAVKEHYEHPNKQQYGHHYKHSLEVCRSRIQNPTTNKEAELGKYLQLKDLPISCHKQTNIGQQRSVIMLSREREEKSSDFLLDGFQQKEEWESLRRRSCNSMDSRHQDFIDYSAGINGGPETDTMLLDIVNRIDIREIEAIYTTEEQCYIQFMGMKFRDKWCEVNIGRKMMSEYILWCKKLKPLSSEVFHGVGRASSERFIRIMESTEDFQHLNTHDKFFLFKSNMEHAHTVTMIRKLSFLNPQDEFLDSWGSADRAIWDESGMNLQVESMFDILRQMPFDFSLKEQFISLLSQCKLPILADQHVFSLLVAIVIFSSGDIQLVDRHKIDSIRESYLTMLKRYVRKDQEHAGDIINRVIMVISVIPKLSELFRQMNTIENG